MSTDMSESKPESKTKCDAERTNPSLRRIALQIEEAKKQERRSIIGMAIISAAFMGVIIWLN